MNEEYNGKTTMNKGKVFKKLLPLLIVVVVIAVVAGVASRTVDHQKVNSDTDNQTATEAVQQEETVEINGVLCTPKKNIKTYLFMGLDAEGEAETVEEYDGTGQCDTLQLLVVDETNNTYTRLPINRDTMTDVKSLDDDGTYLATTYMQISLAHATGDGMETSCENTVDAVSNLLYGQAIDGYASLNMDAIEVLNHLVDGVTVTIEDDFSKEDPSLKMGETVTLTDEQAMHYVRGRMNVGDGSNEGRMRRQSQYLSALKTKLMDKCQADNAFALDIYDSLEPYMVTSLSRNDFIKLAASLVTAQEQDTLEIQGTNAVGDTGFNEFTVDENSLADAVIQLFYDRVENED